MVLFLIFQVWISTLPSGQPVRDAEAF